MYAFYLECTSHLTCLYDYQEDMAKEGKRRQAKSIHYSRCQLCIGEEKIKHRGLMVSRQSVNVTCLVALIERALYRVFAARLCVKNKRWDSFRKRYTWDLYASAVWPRVPRISETAQRVLNKQPITWPKLERRKPVPGLSDTPFHLLVFLTEVLFSFTADIRMDTPESIVAKITYKPPPLPTSVSAPIPKPALESAYINSLFNPSPFPFDESQPVEVHVVKELSNPHSRAKKQARWQRYQGYKDDLRKEMISNELKNLNGRNTREATAEAMYKWRQAIEDEERAKQKARWLTKERVKKIERNRKSKEKKTRRQGERLRDLVLAEAPNQVLPKQVSERRRAA
jgi:hypothetical protein